MKQKSEYVSPEYVSTIWFDDFKNGTETWVGTRSYTKVVDISTQDICFSIGRGYDLEYRDLFFCVYQKQNSAAPSIVSIRYGWSRFFLNKLSKGFKDLSDRKQSTSTDEVNIGLVWDCVQPRKENEGNTYVDLNTNVEKNVNQLIITLGVCGSIETDFVLNNAYNAPFTCGLSSIFSKLAKDEDELPVPNFEHWSY